MFGQVPVDDNCIYGDPTGMILNCLMQLLDSLHTYKLLSLATNSSVGRSTGADAASTLGYTPLQAWITAAQDLISCFEVSERISSSETKVKHMIHIYCCGLHRD